MSHPSAPALAQHQEGAGRRVVLVHGFTQSASSWQRVTSLLEPGVTIVTVDLPGHGGSSGVACTSLEEAGQLVGEVGGEATYVGYSLGGRVCLTLALESPALVQSLVLVGATPGIEDAGARARRAADEALADRLDPPGDEVGIELEAFLEEWLSGPLFAHLNEVQADRASRRSNTAAGLAASLRTTGTGTQRPSHERLSQLSMPVLLLAGEHDERFSAIGEEMARAIGANARFRAIEGSGHAVPFEQPEHFSAVLNEFLRAT